MDWKTIRKDKLEQGSWDSKGRGLPIAVRQALDACRRAWMLSSWGRGIAVGVGILLVIAALFSFVALNGSGDGGPEETVLADRASPTAQPATAVPATDVPPTSEPTEEPATPTRRPTKEPPVVRTDCDAIEGTAYESSEEREWYLANCLDDTLVENPPFVPDPIPVAPQPTSSSAPPASVPEPTPTPASATSFTAADATALALELIDDYGIDEDAGPCNAIRTRTAQWLVSCASSAGTVSVCIIELPLTLWFC